MQHTLEFLKDIEIYKKNAILINIISLSITQLEAQFTIKGIKYNNNNNK